MHFTIPRAEASALNEQRRHNKPASNSHKGGALSFLNSLSHPFEHKNKSKSTAATPSVPDAVRDSTSSERSS